MLNRAGLICALFLLAGSALLLHARIHPVMVKHHGAVDASLDISHLMAFMFCLVDVVLVTSLFCFSKTSVYGYLINGLLVIFATILMGHYSLHGFMLKSTTFWNWLFSSTLPDIGIAWVDFLIGRSLFLTYQNTTA